MNWKIRSEDKEFECPNIETLKLWCEEERIAYDDYVYNPILGRWLYAKDTVEIQSIYLTKAEKIRSKQSNNLGLFLSLMALLLLVLAPFFGVFLMYFAVLLIIVAIAPLAVKFLKRV